MNLERKAKFKWSKMNSYEKWKMELLCIQQLVSLNMQGKHVFKQSEKQASRQIMWQINN